MECHYIILFLYIFREFKYSSTGEVFNILLHRNRNFRLRKHSHTVLHCYLKHNSRNLRVVRIGISGSDGSRWIDLPCRANEPPTATSGERAVAGRLQQRVVHTVPCYSGTRSDSIIPKTSDAATIAITPSTIAQTVHLIRMTFLFYFS